MRVFWASQSVQKSSQHIQTSHESHSSIFPVCIFIFNPTSGCDMSYQLWLGKVPQFKKIIHRPSILHKRNISQFIIIFVDQEREIEFEVKIVSWTFYFLLKKYMQKSFSIFFLNYRLKLYLEKTFSFYYYYFLKFQVKIVFSYF